VGFSNPDIPTYVTTVVMVPIDVARYAALGHVPPTSIINWINQRSKTRNRAGRS